MGLILPILVMRSVEPRCPSGSLSGPEVTPLSFLLGYPHEYGLPCTHDRSVAVHY